MSVYDIKCISLIKRNIKTNKNYKSIHTQVLADMLPMKEPLI